MSELGLRMTEAVLSVQRACLDFMKAWNKGMIRERTPSYKTYVREAEEAIKAQERKVARLKREVHQGPIDT